MRSASVYAQIDRETAHLALRQLIRELAPWVASLEQDARQLEARGNRRFANDVREMQRRAAAVLALFRRVRD